MSLGENIARLRVRQGLSQEELADMLGVSRQSVSKWETDASVPELDKLIKLGEVFGASLDSLVKGESLTTERREDGGRETVPTGTKAAGEGKGRGSRIAGYVYLVIGVVITMILGLMGGFLAGLLFGLPFYVCAVICLTSGGERTGLWCGWALFILVDLYLRYGTGLTWQVIFMTPYWTAEQNYMRLFIAWCQFLVGLFFVLWTAVSRRKRPWEPDQDQKKPVFLGIAGMVCCSLLMVQLNWTMARNHFFSGPIYSAIFLGRAALDYCRMLLLGWLGSVLLGVRRGKKREKGAETE